LKGFRGKGENVVSRKCWETLRVRTGKSSPGTGLIKGAGLRSLILTSDDGPGEGPAYPGPKKKAKGGAWG